MPAKSATMREEANYHWAVNEGFETYVLINQGVKAPVKLEGIILQLEFYRNQFFFFICCNY